MHQGLCDESAKTKRSGMETHRHCPKGSRSPIWANEFALLHPNGSSLSPSQVQSESAYTLLVAKSSGSIASSLARLEPSALTCRHACRYRYAMRAATKKTIVKHRGSQPGTPDEPNLGECLRQLRFERKLSLTDVSALTGISKSTLSRVESDQLSLTYDKLLQLCRGLQIDIAALLEPAQGSKGHLGRRVFTAPGQGREVAVNLVTYSYLCTDLAGKKMTPMTAMIRSRKLAETNGLLKHEGEEFTYVLEGTLELHTELYEPLVLPTGGSVYFDGTMGHAYVSIGETPAKVLCICATPEPVLTQALDAAKAPARAEKITSPPGRRRQK